MLTYPVITELPDPFLGADGTRVTAPAEWPRRRAELAELIQAIEYGHLPPTPAWTRGEVIEAGTVEGLDGVRCTQYRVQMGPAPAFSFTMRLYTPAGDGPFPTILYGDGCWKYLTDEVLAMVLGRGYALTRFDRTEIVPDAPGRDTGLYLCCPDGDFGALAAWAWGYHRVVDVLLTLPLLDPARIAAAGHSRGGKTVLLAAALDTRIALAVPNDSGCAGAGCFRLMGEGCETLGTIVQAFPYWFSPRLSAFSGRETQLPFDQHSLKALVAPRPLLCSESLDDLWANPSGTWQTTAAAREVYRFLGAEDRIHTCYRTGPHAHAPEDWATLLDFADWQFFGKTPTRDYAANPFPGLDAGYTWQVPGE